MCIVFVFFFFKQKTAYEMRISDWSSDVCSSDLRPVAYARQVDDRDLARAKHVRQQKDGDEGRHCEIEIAQPRARDLPGIHSAKQIAVIPLHEPCCPLHPPVRIAYRPGQAPLP